MAACGAAALVRCEVWNESKDFDWLGFILAMVVAAVIVGVAGVFAGLDGGLDQACNHDATCDYDNLECKPVNGWPFHRCLLRAGQ